MAGAVWALCPECVSRGMGSRDSVVPDRVGPAPADPHRTIRIVTISAPWYIRRSTPPSRANPFLR